MLVAVIFGGISHFSLLAKSTIEVNATMHIDQFSDVKKTDWFYDDINYVLKKGLMNGTASELFSPNKTTKRGMIVTILWRLEDKSSEVKTEFLDVQKDTYYYDAVNWAYANGIVNGYNETSFGPEDDITREQLATIIYKYALYKKYDVSEKASLDRYEDANSISGYAISALEWASAKAIIMGTQGNMLLPQDTALRCEVAAILHRFCLQFISDKGEVASNFWEKVPKIEDEQNSLISVDNTDNKPPKETQEDYPMLELTSISAKAGDNAKLAVKIKNNPGILGMTLTVHYDQANIKLKNAENGDAFRDILNLTISKSLTCGTRFAWDGLELAPGDIKDGTILYMNFSVLDSAKKGKYPITLTYAEGDMVDSNLKSISLPIVNGYITVVD